MYRVCLANGQVLRCHADQMRLRSAPDKEQDGPDISNEEDQWVTSSGENTSVSPIVPSVRNSHRPVSTNPYPTCNRRPPDRFIP